MELLCFFFVFIFLFFRRTCFHVLTYCNKKTKKTQHFSVIDHFLLITLYVINWTIFASHPNAQNTERAKYSFVPSKIFVLVPSNCHTYGSTVEGYWHQTKECQLTLKLCIIKAFVNTSPLSFRIRMRFGNAFLASFPSNFSWKCFAQFRSCA